MRDADELQYARRVSRRDIERRRTTTRLSGPDVVDHCKKCGGPIFTQCWNVANLAGRHVDGTPRKKHRRCSEATR